MSCNAPRFSGRTGNTPESTSTGMRATLALAMPVIALVTPGACGDQGHAQATSQFCVGVRQVDGGPLVAHVDDADALGVQPHPDRHDVPAAQAKHSINVALARARLVAVSLNSRLLDRKSNMIISCGENVYPSEVEGVLGAHPTVKDVAVIGVPHDKWGESVHAVVVLHQPKSPPLPPTNADAGAEAEIEAELKAWCKARMASFKCPQPVVFLADADMPRTATGKIPHRVLRKRVAADGVMSARA